MLSAINSKILNKVRIPLALGVFLSHAMCAVDSELLFSYKDTNITESVSYWGYVCLSTLMPILVIPGFFMISGYLFFLKWTSNDKEKIWDWSCYISKLKSRFFTLFLPYIVWNIIPLITILATCFYHNVGKPTLLSEMIVCLQGKFPQMFWDINKWDASTGPLNLPLYYVRDLMGMCLVSPIVFLICKKTRHYGLIAILLLNIAEFIPSYSGLRNTGITFFSLGAYFSIMNKDIVDEICRYGKYFFAASLFLSLIIIGIFALDDSVMVYITRLYSLIGLFGLFWIVKITSDKYNYNYPVVITESIFFVYAAHEGLMLLDLSSSISHILLPTSSALSMLCQYIITIILVLVLCTALYALLKIYVPNICNFLNGKYNYSRKKQS